MHLKKQTSWVALLTAIIFLTSNTAWGMPTKLVGLKVDVASAPIDLEHFSIPSNLGSVQEVYNVGGDRPTVALIQDAHEIPEAQKNIHNLISFFQAKHGVDLVALEGAAEQLDSQIFRSFPDRQILKSVFKEYFDRGELTGGTAAAIFNDQLGGKYFGIEDWDLYEKGLRLYLQAVEKEKELLDSILASEDVLIRTKKSIYSEELLNLDQMLNDFYDDHMNLVEVMKALAVVSPPKEGSELDLILKETAEGPTDNFELEREVRRVAREVQAILSGRKHPGLIPKDTRDKLLREFNVKHQQFQVSSLKPEAFALELKELTAEYNLPIKVTKQLAGLMSEQKRVRNIKGTRLFTDFEKYAQETKETLMTSERERELDFETRKLRLLHNLAKLELSRDDWEVLKADPKGYLDGAGDFRYQLAFYENAEARDHAFYKNLNRELGQSAVLVAGGFHTEGLIREFRRENISYVLLMPAMKSVPEVTNYREHMRGEVSWSDYFKVEDGRVNLYQAFVRGTRDKLLQKAEEQNGRTPLRKHWRDQIIRDLAKEERVQDAKKYTGFLDEISTARKKSGADAWMKNVKGFTAGLKKLEATGRVNKQEILKLLQPSSTIPTLVVSVGAQISPDGYYDANMIQAVQTDASWTMPLDESVSPTTFTYDASIATSEPIIVTAAPEISNALDDYFASTDATQATLNDVATALIGNFDGTNITDAVFTSFRSESRKNFSKLGATLMLVLALSVSSNFNQTETLIPNQPQVDFLIPNDLPGMADWADVLGTFDGYPRIQENLYSAARGYEELIKSDPTNENYRAAAENFKASLTDPNIRPGIIDGSLELLIPQLEKVFAREFLIPNNLPGLESWVPALRQFDDYPGIQEELYQAARDYEEYVRDNETTAEFRAGPESFRNQLETDSQFRQDVIDGKVPLYEKVTRSEARDGEDLDPEDQNRLERALNLPKQAFDPDSIRNENVKQFAYRVLGDFDISKLNPTFERGENIGLATTALITLSNPSLVSPLQVGANFFLQLTLRYDSQADQLADNVSSWNFNITYDEPNEVEPIEETIDDISGEGDFNFSDAKAEIESALQSLSFNPIFQNWLARRSESRIDRIRPITPTVATYNNLLNRMPTELKTSLKNRRNTQLDEDLYEIADHVDQVLHMIGQIEGLEEWKSQEERDQVLLGFQDVVNTLAEYEFTRLEVELGTLTRNPAITAYSSAGRFENFESFKQLYRSTLEGIIQQGTVDELKDLLSDFMPLRSEARAEDLVSEALQKMNQADESEIKIGNLELLLDVLRGLRDTNDGRFKTFQEGDLFQRDLGDDTIYVPLEVDLAFGTGELGDLYPGGTWNWIAFREYSAYIDGIIDNDFMRFAGSIGDYPRINEIELTGASVADDGTLEYDGLYLPQENSVLKLNGIYDASKLIDSGYFEPSSNTVEFTFNLRWIPQMNMFRIETIGNPPTRSEAREARQVWRGVNQRTGEGYNLSVALSEFEDVDAERVFLQGEFGKIFREFQNMGLEFGSRIKLGVDHRADGSVRYTFVGNIPGRGKRSVVLAVSPDGSSRLVPRTVNQERMDLFRTAVGARGVDGFLYDFGGGFIFDQSARRAVVTSEQIGDQLIFTVKARNADRGEVTVQMALSKTGQFVKPNAAGVPFSSRGSFQFSSNNASSPKTLTVGMPETTPSANFNFAESNAAVTEIEDPSDLENARDFERFFEDEVLPELEPLEEVTTTPEPIESDASVDSVSEAETPVAEVANPDQAIFDILNELAGEDAWRDDPLSDPNAMRILSEAAAKQTVRLSGLDLSQAEQQQEREIALAIIDSEDVVRGLLPLKTEDEESVLETRADVLLDGILEALEQDPVAGRLPELVAEASAFLEESVVARSETRGLTTAADDLTMAFTTTLMALVPNISTSQEALDALAETWVTNVTTGRVTSDMVETELVTMMNETQNAAMFTFMQAGLNQANVQLDQFLRGVVADAQARGINVAFDLSQIDDFAGLAEDALVVETLQAFTKVLQDLGLDGVGASNTFIFAGGQVTRDASNVVREVGANVMTERRLNRLASKADLLGVEALPVMKLSTDLTGLLAQTGLMPTGINFETDEVIGLEARDLSLRLLAARAIISGVATTADELNLLESQMLDALSLFKDYGAPLGVRAIQNAVVQVSIVSDMLRAFAIDAMARQRTAASA